MRESRQCPKCSDRRLVHLKEVYGHGQTLALQRQILRLAEPPLSAAFLASRSRAGEVEAYVCTVCGYFEEYVLDVGEIDWDAIQGCTWHSKEEVEKGPYR